MKRFISVSGENRRQMPGIKMASFRYGRTVLNGETRC